MNDLLSPEILRLGLMIGGGLSLCLLIIWIVYRIRARKSVERKLRKAANDILVDFLIPDGGESEIHVQYALLTSRGAVIVDVRDVKGHVFGSDAMEEWTVLADRQRFTFSNPQHALFDRMAAVKRLLPDVPVEGYVVFTNRADFTKGQPTHVRILDRLLEELQKEKEDMPAKFLEDFQPQWDQLRTVAVIDQSLPR
jgi:hypothetical protein